MYRNTSCMEHDWHNVYVDKGDVGQKSADSSGLHNIMAGAVLCVRKAGKGIFEKSKQT